MTLHQLELVTRALCDGRLEPAQERLPLAGSNEQDPRILLQGINHLKLEYPECIQAGWKIHGQYLYSIHGGYITEQGYNMELIRETLEVQEVQEPSDEPEPEGEREDEGIQSEPDGEEAEEGNSEGGLPSSTTSSGRITVENEQERRSTTSRRWVRFQHPSTGFACIIGRRAVQRPKKAGQIKV